MRPPSDVWAIGIILHELLAGRRPFCDADTTDLYESIRTAAPPPLPAQVPESICSVVHKCLAKNPENRYQTAAAVADHLEDWLAGRPVVVPAPPPSPSGRSTPPWLVTVCICVLVALIFLPPVLIPFGQAHEAPLVANESAPLSLVQLLNRDGKVQLTNETGKPLFPLRKIPGHDLAIAIQDGHHRFWGRNAYGMMEFSGDKLPLPIVLEGDVGVSLGSAEPLTSITTAGIYVGRRNWPSASPEIQKLHPLHDRREFFGNASEATVSSVYGKGVCVGGGRSGGSASARRGTTSLGSRRKELRVGTSNV